MIVLLYSFIGKLGVIVAQKAAFSESNLPSILLVDCLQPSKDIGSFCSLETIGKACTNEKCNLHSGRVGVHTVQHRVEWLKTYATLVYIKLISEKTLISQKSILGLEFLICKICLTSTNSLFVLRVLGHLFKLQ